MLGVVALVAAGCGSGRTDEGSGTADTGDAIVVGTTDKIVTLDPAGAYDNGSFTPMNQVYPFLMNFAPGNPTLAPDAAESCGFSQPTVYTCKLKPGLKFANGNPLTATSVKFSYDRITKINDPNGPASLLGQLEKTDVVDDLTVAFTLKAANDQTFPLVLATNAGPIVDEKVFPADKLLDDAEIVEKKPFAGPYSIESYQKNQLVEYKAIPDYNGILGKPKTDAITVRYFATTDSLKIDTQNNDIDVGFRSYSPTDLESLAGMDNVVVHEGIGGELRYIVFNMNTMPGDTPEQKLAVRKAIASSVDRDALSNDVYKGNYLPAYSSVVEGLPGAKPSYKEIYGEKPNKEAAAKFLADAGVATPVVLNLQYNPDHYGGSSSEEYAAIKSQLDGTGLFTVNLQSTEWVTYQKERVQDAYPLYQLGWFPDFVDADNYLTPFFAPNNFLQNHFENPVITDLLVKETTEPDKAKREEILRQVQDELARNYISMLPLLAGKQFAVSGKNIAGVDETLDASFKFRYTVLSKN
ncbi:peptide ABC transporter substrate-binding protein [Antrihabitans sp. YC3-6]|uniref:Peptide ABC transporter substrate-binding protein n=1 Tax=Antrihabitans stalagmiti TaxID=2799499 RepID=A0A934NS10_9NOCA|nr:ABC transporter substrate-binding protein [Antrihabitans stalagmiti]MBJ8340406.1 peptide ABC transporter substrate-binding protein [Antrihabitans stalagmiti]